MKQLSDLDRGWFAGPLEGEGCFSVRNDRGNPRVTVVLQMTDEDVVLRAAGLVDVGRIYGPCQPTNGGRRPYWAWRVSRHADVRMLLDLTYDLMGARRRAKIDEIRAALGW